MAITAGVKKSLSMPIKEFVQNINSMQFRRFQFFNLILRGQFTAKCSQRNCQVGSQQRTLLTIARAVVETDSSETKTETAKFFRDQDRSRSQFWLRDRDR